MLKIEMEFKRGILFVRLDGNLTKRTSSKFDNEVLPIILKHGIKYVVINLDKVLLIDEKGLESLMELNEVVSSFKGKTTLCSLTNNIVKEKIDNFSYNNLFYETSNELTALGVIKL